MIFWLCLIGYAAIEVVYDLATDHTYFWFANAEQAQAVFLAMAVFTQTPYSATKKKVAGLLVCMWSVFILASDWSEVVNVRILSIYFIVLSAFAGVSIAKIWTVQSKQQTNRIPGPSSRHGRGKVGR